MDTKLKFDLANAADKAKYDEHAKRIVKQEDTLHGSYTGLFGNLRSALEEIEQAICGDVIIGGSVLPDGIISRQQEDPVPGENTIYFDLRLPFIGRIRNSRSSSIWKRRRTTTRVMKSSHEEYFTAPACYLHRWTLNLPSRIMMICKRYILYGYAFMRRKRWGMQS